ncbi:DUF418 domain-containing protein [Qipengyuania spongiae]|uniref:DUF418 domain-containing protein n=1 Tax=Qipengyuania spongiae TaxID=2909673 RepID=A0ABY5T1T5_9SPHN|nr:DUF418 domain-containing protein [Qipengyuania spongiae]UVI39288.1 DUF418 domain-containing protein [Qipengyuania spongiae]
MSATRVPAGTPDQPGQFAPTGPSADRIASLDFIRGIAVMGILVANIVAFGQPFSAYIYPGAFLTPHGTAENAMWIAQFVLIDGKMRGLFTLLFGAGLYLFMERAWARGAARALQVRRLLFLGLFGLIHYFLIWEGDILFLYAASGLVALLFVRLSEEKQLALGLIGYVLGGLLYLGLAFSLQAAADGSFPGTPEAAQEMRVTMAEGKQHELSEALVDAQLVRSGDYSGLVAHRFAEHVGDLSNALITLWTETLPLMLIGMALYRFGLFSGAIAGGRFLFWGAASWLTGALANLWIAQRVAEGGFSYYGTMAAFTGWSHFPNLMTTLGYATLLAVWCAAARGWLAVRVKAAGRAAFTNYLGTSAVMMMVFHGWAGGLFGEFTRGELYMVMLVAWVLMLAWSKPWLDRFRYGPLEWLWRCLTYQRVFPLLR